MNTPTPADHLHAVDRSVRPTHREGRETRTLTASRRYDATPDEVWGALVDPQRLSRWLLPVTGDLRVGGRYQLQGNAGGEILVCEPAQRLSVTWVFGEQVSWVEVTLSPEDGTTVLRLEHTLPLDDHWTQYGPGAVGIGWELTLMGLAEHLIDDTFTQPAPEQPPGLRDFTKASSDAWAEADIKGGADPEAAWSAAARCLAAYTGEPQ